MTIKRISAYLIDILIVLILSNLLSTVLPNHDKIVSMSEESDEIITEYLEVLDGTTEEIEKYSNKLNDFTYQLSKESVYSNFATIILYFLYFIVFQSYNNGQTVGKRLLKIEVASEKEEELSFKHLLIRGIILYPILFNFLDIIALLILKQSSYENISVVLALTKYILYICCFIPILFGKKGIHDKLAGTCVVDALGDAKEESKASKWKKTSDKEQEIKKYRVNHTSGKRKE